MKRLAVLLALAGLVVPTSAAAAGPPAFEQQDSSVHDDFGVQLVDMFATMADVLSHLQDQAANEAHLGSASADHRLMSSLDRLPDRSVRGARPFIQGWLLGEE